jgi:M6 family metalloprotease-like protein
VASLSKYLKKYCLYLAGCLCFASLVAAAPPRDWKYLKDKSEGFKPCKTMSGETIEAFKMKGLFRASLRAGTIASTTDKLLVIRVDFWDSQWMGTSPANIGKMFSGLRDYYYENSYGLYTVTATVTSNVYRMPYSIDNYNDETDAELLALANDALNKAVADGVDITPYQYFLVCHAGYGEEETRNENNIWSLTYNGTVQKNGKEFAGFCVVPETSPNDPSCSPLSVICHEFGHQLGLPDLYDTAQGVSTCGAWTLMDYNYGVDGSGRNPPHLDPWSKSMLGFIDLSTRTVTAGGGLSTMNFGDIETSQTTGFLRTPVYVSADDECFILEYRNPDAARMKYDLNIPGSGILIWHINGSIASKTSYRYLNNTVNNGTDRGVVLVTADRTDDFPPGEAADAFTGGSVFACPRSNDFNDIETGITFGSISFAGNTAEGVLGTIAATPETMVSKLINYPNPAGKGYPPRSGSGALTTFVLNTTRPPRVINMTIYDLAGEKIGMVQRDNFSLNIGNSRDLHWVYEYDWNGKNESGEDVAPGVYLYRLKADDETKVGKMAVVR